MSIGYGFHWMIFELSFYSYKGIFHRAKFMVHIWMFWSFRVKDSWCM